jgi:hydroxypyruvate reductase
MVIGTHTSRCQNRPVDTQARRETLRSLFDVALASVEPERLTREALSEGPGGPATLIAIGKAAPAMCRGAAAAIGQVTGICVTDHVEEVPTGLELVVGDHPVPGDRSFSAGRMVLEAVTRSTGRIVALVSGGGSALCEHPVEGVPAEFLAEASRVMLDRGASIGEMNLVRRHLSAIKGGGLLEAAGRPIETYAISDVCGADPNVIASGPTVPQSVDPEAALSVLRRIGIEVPLEVAGAVSNARPGPRGRANITVLADGRTAAQAMADESHRLEIASAVTPGWLSGPVARALEVFILDGRPGLHVAAGEPVVEVMGRGSGGRNTHAALLAASAISGSDSLFAAFATDGVDGNSRSAGAIVDGDTIARGGDPAASLDSSDSATYLAKTGDLVVTGPTGTNVADIWVHWRS